MESNKSKYEPSLSPVRKLPQDLLGQIFSLYVEGDQRLSEAPYREWLHDEKAVLRRFLKCPPWALGQVCRMWRATALSFPQLWTSFYVDHAYTPTLSSISTHRHLDPLLTQLERCQNQPIEVFLAHYTDTLPKRSVLAALCENGVAMRWTSATIYLHKCTCEVMQPYAGTFRNITSLHLHAKDFGPYPEEEDQIFDMFYDAPNLRTPSIWGRCWADHSDPVLSLPWNQITRYTAREADNDYWTSNGFHYDVLPLLKNVEECWLDCTFSTDEPEYIRSGAGPLTLLHLHTLVLSSVDWNRPNSAINRLLDQLSLPALRVLKFRNGIPGGSRSLQNMLSRSDYSLDELVLFDVRDIDHVNDEINGLLNSHQLASLHNLTICSDHSGESEFCLRMLDALTVRPERKPLLPNL